MTNNSNIQRLNQLYFYLAREMAWDDLETAQTVTGLPTDFLQSLCEADLDAVANAAEAASVLPFQPRLPQHLLSRLLKSPAEVGDATAMIGVNANASLTD